MFPFYNSVEFMKVQKATVTNRRRGFCEKLQAHVCSQKTTASISGIENKRIPVSFYVSVATSKRLAAIHQAILVTLLRSDEFRRYFN